MKLLTLAAAVLAAASVFPVPAAAADTEVYSDYSRMDSRVAGQVWDSANTGAVSQWSWTPQADSSLVAWGVPTAWPPGYQEKFVHSGDWVLLDGWYDNGTYYKLDVRQWLSDADCKTNRTVLPSGAQRYVKWDVPPVGSGYCLFAQGTITEQSSGKTVLFAHQQVWTNVGPVANPLRGNASAPALRQTEIWWDDNGAPYGKRTQRDVYFAKGFGPAWKTQNYDPATGAPTSTTYLKYVWPW